MSKEGAENFGFDEILCRHSLLISQQSFVLSTTLLLSKVLLRKVPEQLVVDFCTTNGGSVVTVKEMER
jgi:hypothetical protein